MGLLRLLVLPIALVVVVQLLYALDHALGKSPALNVKYILITLRFSTAAQNNLVSAIISSIFCLVIFGALRFYAEWFSAEKLNTIAAGYIASWVFIFGITAVSNVEMLIFGQDFQAKFIPEIIFCLLIAAGVAGSIVHRVAATTCILFSFVGLYFINRISNKHYNKLIATNEPTAVTRRSGGKRK